MSQDHEHYEEISKTPVEVRRTRVSFKLKGIEFERIDYPTTFYNYRTFHGYDSVRYEQPLEKLQEPEVRDELARRVAECFIKDRFVGDRMQDTTRLNLTKVSDSTTVCDVSVSESRVELTVPGRFSLYLTATANINEILGPK